MGVGIYDMGGWDGASGARYDALLGSRGAIVGAAHLLALLPDFDVISFWIGRAMRLEVFLQWTGEEMV